MSENPEMLMIINSGGVPLLTQFISPNDINVEPILVSAFLSAIQSFSDEISSNKNKDMININLGNQYLILYYYGNFSIGAMVNHDNITVRKQLRYIGDEFKKILNSDSFISTVNEGITRLFKNIILKVFSKDRISSNWIPKINQTNFNSDLKNQHKIIDSINDSNTVSQITRLTNNSLLEVKFLLYMLWIGNQITFSKQLDLEMLVMQNENSRRFLLQDGMYCDYYYSFKNAGNLPACEKDTCFDCKSTLKKIQGPTALRVLMCKHELERQEILRCLIDQGLLTLLTRIHAQFISIKSIVTGVCNAMRIHLKEEELRNLINDRQEILNNIGAINEIIFSGNKITIDTAMDNYVNFTSDEIIKIINVWINFITDLIEGLPTKKKKKVIMTLMKNNSEDLINFYQDEFDHRFERYNNFLHLLEAISAY